MDIYNMTQTQREADLAHTEAVQAVRVAEDTYASARREYFDATEQVATMIEDMGVNDALRIAIYRAIAAAQNVGTADEAVSTAKVRQSICALRARILTGTLTPSDFN